MFVIQNDPDLLPRKELLALCLNTVGTSGAEVQRAATEAVIEVAKSSNGEEGATEVTPEEVETLLEALHSPATAVRDITLLVSAFVYFII